MDMDVMLKRFEQPDGVRATDPSRDDRRWFRLMSVS